SNQDLTGWDFAVARLHEDGSLDGEFGVGGIRTIDLGSAEEEALGLAVRSDGNIVAAGYSLQADSTYHFAVVRLLGPHDTEGVPRSMEQGPPNNGDGNNDHIPDSQQENVTSLPNLVDSQYVTLQSDVQTTLVGVTALPAPPPELAPPGAVFPIGALAFSVTGV